VSTASPFFPQKQERLGTRKRRKVAHALVDLGQMVLKFGRVDRITFHEDGKTLESDTDHTVMLGIIACAFAAEYLPHLDLGKIAQYSLLHDLPEVYAGDTPTLVALSADGKAAKQAREEAAIERISLETFALPWVAWTIRDYERRADPESRYVKAMDKMLPKITHILNGCATPIAEGMTYEALKERYEIQGDELLDYAMDFEPLWDLRGALIDMVLTEMDSRSPK
jgi:5'-deoxynucleotidase YfbR-like HD superfamily hydrolase